MPSVGRSTLASLVAAQQELEARIQDLVSVPAQTLAIGEALLSFAAREDEVFSSLAPVMDPDARSDLAAEHGQFAEDLELLAWLLRTAPESRDLAVLDASLVRRMRQHIERDGRLLALASALNTRR